MNTAANGHSPIRTRFSPSNPCLVCDSGSKGCSVTDDGLHLCRGTPADPAVWRKLGEDEHGFGHYRQEDADRPPPRPRRAVAPAVDWRALAVRFATAFPAARRADLAASLSLPAVALDAFPLAGWKADEGCWTFPMTDAAGKVVGISRRFPPGQTPPRLSSNKAVIQGGTQGLYLPLRWRVGGGPLLVVEGASDTLAATHAGLKAVGRPNNSGGAELLTALLADWPAGRPIVVLGENDRKPAGGWPGREGAEKVGTALAAKLRRPMLIAFPPVGAKDVRAWLTADARSSTPWPDRGRELLAHLEATAERIEPPEATLPPTPLPPSCESRPEVVVTVELHQTARKVREVLSTAPGVYRRGNTLVREDEGRLAPLRADALPEFLSELVRFKTRTVKGNGDAEEKRVKPPADVCKAVFARPDSPIREVRAVAAHPVMLPDGRILTRPGYDAASGWLLAGTSALALDLPENPTQADARRAAEVLLAPFADFRLVDDNDDDPEKGEKGGCSRAAIAAVILTLLARPAIDGPTPFFLVTKNVPAAGGSLLVKAAGRIVTGGELPAASYAYDPAEMSKLLTTWAVEGWPVVNLDNLAGDVGDAELCRAITCTKWSGRILGASKTFEGSFATVLIGSANNARLASDMPRRTLAIRLRVDDPRPEARTGFAWELPGGIDAHRPRLLSAALTILKAWVAAERPRQTLPAFGSFEAWSGVVRQALVFAGLSDPYRPTTDREDRRRRLLVAIAGGMSALDPDRRGMSARAIVRRLTAATDGDDPAVREAADALAELSDRQTAASLGQIFAKEQGRNFGGLRIAEAPARDRTNNARWVVEDAPRHNTPAVEPTAELPAFPANDCSFVHSIAGNAGSSGRGAAGHTAGPTSREASGESPPISPTELERLLRTAGWGIERAAEWIDSRGGFLDTSHGVGSLTPAERRQLAAQLEAVIAEKGGGR